MLFLSYSWGDSRAAHSIANGIRNAGQAVWLDVTHLNVQADIESQLFSAISAASMFLHLDSPCSRASHWVSLERSIATRLNKMTFDVPAQLLMEAVRQLPHNNALRAEPRAARFLKSMSFAAAR